MLFTYGKRLAIKRKGDLLEISAEINNLVEKGTFTFEEQVSLNKLQNKLDKIYEEKAKGAFIRSRKQWLEMGEKNSKYFFNLEKRRVEVNAIKKMKIGGVICEDKKLIASHITEFFGNLYKSDSNVIDPFPILNSITLERTVSNDFNLICSKNISLEEVKEAINKLKNNKSPGTDGLTSELYKTFHDHLSTFLLAVYEESFVNGCLPSSMREGVITLVPKSHKDTLVVDNWRPITLLNNDYKILASILAERLKYGLDDLIDECQSGFIKGHHISNNIRLVLDLIDYRDLVLDPALIMFLDFQKAFDTVSHNFILSVLQYFDFNNYFINAVKTLYVRGNSCVKLLSGTTPKFSIHRGIRQGCPVSPFLFLLVTQILYLMVNQNKVFKGIRIHDKEIKISQYADDTTLFLKDQSEVPKALEIIKDFSQVSGLSVNISKCEILSLKNLDKTSICGIQLKDVINYLGVKISINSNMVLAEINLNPIKDMIRKKFNSWLARDLSLAGRVLLSKAEGLSRVSYLFSVMDCPKSSCAFLDKLLYNFIWKNKSHKVKKEVLRNNISDGGLEVIDFTLFNHVLKVNWLKRFVKKTDSIWNTIPNFIFKKIGGI